MRVVRDSVCVYAAAEGDIGYWIHREVLQSGCQREHYQVTKDGDKKVWLIGRQVLTYVTTKLSASLTLENHVVIAAITLIRHRNPVHLCSSDDSESDCCCVFELGGG